MKKSLVALALSGLLAVSLTAQDKGTTTVVRRNADGETEVLTRGITDGEYQPTAAVHEVVCEVVATDDTPRKARVAVVPAVFAPEHRRRIAREFFEQFGISDLNAIENPGYTSYLIDALVNVRKFDILEREDLRQVVRELDFGERDYVDLEKVVKIGNMVGADYMIIPTIRDLEADRETENVPYAGEQPATVHCKLTTNVRVVDVAAGKIIASGVREVEKEKRQREQNSLRILVMDTIGECYKESALLDAAKIVDAVYPIRIMSIEGDTKI